MAKSKIDPAEIQAAAYFNGRKLRRIKPSTIVKVELGSIKLLRKGPIKFDEIKKAIE